MRYFKEYDANGRLFAIGTGAFNGVEITAEEYAALSEEINRKAELEDNLYWGKITVSDIPEAWQEEIQIRVVERVAEFGTAEEQPISASEALEIILGGAVE